MRLTLGYAAARMGFELWSAATLVGGTPDVLRCGSLGGDEMQDRAGVAGEHAVVIAGGGPTGLMLAGELALAGCDVALVERRVEQTLEGARAGGLHARSLEVLEQRGIAARFLEAGQAMQLASYARVPLDMSDLPTRHPYGLALPQEAIERLLAAWVEELEVPIYRGVEVTGFTQDASGVDVALSDGRQLRGGYLAGCDGGRSLVRQQAGIELAGWEASVSYLIAEGETQEEPAYGLRRGPQGVYGLGRLEGGRVRIVLSEPEVRAGATPTLEEVREALAAVYGTDFGLCRVTWASRFSDAARQAVAYRARRVFLAGDAAHVHSPIGGQGLNTGLQDAVNLGWKLGLAARGEGSEALLESYHAERHPVAARVLRHTLSQTALDRGDERTRAAVEALTELLQLPEARRRYAAMMSGLDITYDLGAGHPLRGRRMPDLELHTAQGGQRVSALLHAARPVLLTLSDAGEPPDAAPWAAKLLRVEARSDGPWELPGVGAVPAPAAVLLRPDGHVAWVGGEAGLEEVLRTWFQG